jgi:hypothetical protein
MKPNLTREMVNELRDVANAFSGTEQLRDRISHVIHKYLAEPQSEKQSWQGLSDMEVIVRSNKAQSPDDFLGGALWAEERLQERN